MNTSDLDLLREYTRGNSEPAFAELVNRHLNLVYSAALRQVQSHQLAEEIAQSAFTDLARAAHRLAPDTILTAWLYQVTRRTAIDVVRREARRQLREQIATEMNAINATAADWTHIEPLLDDAMQALDDTDRAAILLRYFENKSLREVGAVLGASDDAAQKRVSRAVERLREFFTKRGVAVGAGGIAAVISVNAVQAAPAGLAVTISTAAALAATPVVTAATATAAKTIAMTTLQKAFVATVIAAAVGTGIYQARQTSALQAHFQDLQQQQAQELAQMRQERDDATNHLSTLLAENQQLKLHKDDTELLKLRGEVTRLQADSKELAQLKNTPNEAKGDPTETAAKSWLDRVNKLKQHLEFAPNAKIPEFQYLTEQDWLNAAQTNLNSVEDYRKALASLRQAAEGAFTSKLQPALQQYMQANNDQFPSDLSQLKQYFDAPVDDSVLQRYEIIPASSMKNMQMGGDWLITEKAPVDADYDYRSAIGPHGSGVMGPGGWATDTSKGN